MRKFMENRRNKKGFTLAELLIVVAIIAVLVAIAIPIFMNSLAKAEKAAELANIRSVKAAAINKILNEYDTGEKLGTTSDNKVAKCWKVKAEVENGDVIKCEVTPEVSASVTTTSVTKEDNGKNGYKYTIELEIKDTEVDKVS